MVLAHTPFRSLAASLGDKPVLVAGSGDVAHVAATYGFKHVVTTGDLARALPSAVPFWKDTGENLVQASTSQTHHLRDQCGKNSVRELKTGY